MATDHERSLADRGVRKGLGAYYTPPDVVDGLLDLALDPILERLAADGPEAVAALRVIDPACGTGNFLVAAARRIADVARGARLVRRGRRGRAPCAASAASRSTRRRRRSCRAALREVDPSSSGRQVRRGDALLDPKLAPEGAFDLVIGNPPFLSQLGSSTARSVTGGAALRARFGASVAGYTDPAALFLVLGHRLARPDGGVVAMIEPVSLLTARDAAECPRGRARRRRAHRPVGRWATACSMPRSRCARRSSSGRRARPRPGSTPVGSGSPATRSPAPSPGDRSWSGLLADHGGLPRRTLETDGTSATWPRPRPTSATSTTGSRPTSSTRSRRSLPTDRTARRSSRPG